MRPLAPVVAGLAVVVVDVRTEHLDLVPDAAGWAMVVVGTLALALRGPAFAAAAAGVLSLADLHLPSRLRYVNPLTGELASDAEGRAESYGRHLTFDELQGLHLVLVVAAALAGAVALSLLAASLLRRATADADLAAAHQLAALRWLLPLAWAGPTVVLAALHPDGYDPVWNGGQELLALAGIGAVVWLGVLLAARAGARWALPPTVPLRPLRGPAPG